MSVDMIDPPSAKAVFTFVVDGWSEDRINETMERIDAWLNKQAEVRQVNSDWQWI